MPNTITISRRLGLSFAAIIVCAALMMTVFCINITMIHRATVSSNFSQAIHADALALETALLRQNSQLRGYLVTGDESYLKSYYEGRDDYDRIAAALAGRLTTPALLKDLATSREATQAWRRNWGDRMVAKVRSGAREQAMDEVRHAGKAVLVTDAVLPLRTIRDEQNRLIGESASSQNRAITTAAITLALGAVILIGLALWLSRMLAQVIARPIVELTGSMRGLASGDHYVAVPGIERADELGDMARAVLVFREAAAAKAASEGEQAHVVTELGKGLEAVAAGDMTYAITQPFAGAYDKLRLTFNSAVQGLEGSFSRVATAAQTVHAASSEIRAASEDLAGRTEMQASKIEESATRTRRVSDAVTETARGTATVQQAVGNVQSDAKEGGDVVALAVGAMGEIEKSSREIEQIINVIDGIAFQTNLLALNAGVEAARAGEAGKGFAVVASEVRALAQRSADAASDIKGLISGSAQHVSRGVTLVGDTGKVLGRIVAKIDEVTTMISEMAVSTEAQAGSLKDVNSAVAAMDGMTQQNAAMVEETTASARNLAAQASELAELVGKFRLRGESGQDRPVGRIAPMPAAAIARAPARAPAAAPPPVALSSGNLALKPAAPDDDWSEF